MLIKMFTPNADGLYIFNKTYYTKINYYADHIIFLNVENINYNNLLEKIYNLILINHNIIIIIMNTEKNQDIILCLKYVNDILN